MVRNWIGSSNSSLPKLSLRDELVIDEGESQNELVPNKMNMGTQRGSADVTER